MKVPYPMTAAVDYHSRCEQMAHSIAVANERGYPRLQAATVDERPEHRLSLACYGPSLCDTWEVLRDMQQQGVPIVSMSGATRFLADRGVIPDFHIDMDPRTYKAKHLDPPVPGVHYLMASVCPSLTWDILKGQRVTLWHTYSGKDPVSGETTYDWVRQHDNCGLPVTDPTPRTSVVVHGGSTIGLTGMHLAGILGYRHLEIHAMDGSFADETLTRRHAGVHFGKEQKDFTTWNAEGVKYHTSKIMANAVSETINTIRNFPMFCVFHGRGLTQALVREANVPNACTADQTDKAAFVRNLVCEVRKTTIDDAGWDPIVRLIEPEWLVEIQQAFLDNEPLRAKARYDTGTVGFETALLLRAVCAHLRPKVIVEVGTFIGNSTSALKARSHLYTCDRDNDCVASTPQRTCFPYQTSTQMFAKLVADRVKVDLLFLDGRLQPPDLALVPKLLHAKSAIALDDCIGKQKGTMNLALLGALFPQHRVVRPYPKFEGRSTLALMLPPS